MKHDLIFIGAGPAGLALAYQLEQRKTDRISYVIVDIGKTVGETWRSMPRHMRVISPVKANTLDYSRGDHDSGYRMAAHEYADYLEKFASQHDFNLKLGRRVTQVSPSDAGYTVEVSGEAGADQETIEGRFLVNATGYFGNPFIPAEINFSRANIPIVHFSEFIDAQEFKAKGYKKALIVGKRLSAGQIVVELNEVGIDSSISTRSPVKFGIPLWAFNRFFRVMLEFENAILKVMFNKNIDLDIRMEAGKEKRLIESGEVKLLPPIRSVDKRAVNFIDGSKDEYDLIIMTTGFRPCFAHREGLLGKEEANRNFSRELSDNFEHPEHPGLFFLGLDQQVNFRSRFLRGIRDDAVSLGTLLNSRNS